MKWAAKADLTGEALTKYKNYRAGSSEVTYNRSPESLAGELKLIYLNPFAVPAAEVWETRMSQRAFENIGDVLDGAGLLNHKNVPTDLSEVRSSSKFRPAKAIITKAGSGYTSATSKVTGLPYKKRTGASTYTIPFGSAGGSNETSKYLAVCENIQAAVEAKARKNGVTFSPEFF